MAAQSFPCTEDEIEVEQLGLSRHVKGCGKEDVFIYDGMREKWVSLRERAAFEFSCEKDEIKVQVLDSMSIGVTGCNRKAVYKTDWMHGFVMNSADEGATKGRPPKEAPAEGDDAPAKSKDGEQGKSL